MLRGDWDFIAYSKLQRIFLRGRLLRSNLIYSNRGAASYTASTIINQSII